MFLNALGAINDMASANLIQRETSAAPGSSLATALNKTKMVVLANTKEAEQEMVNVFKEIDLEPSPAFVLVGNLAKRFLALLHHDLLDEHQGTADHAQAQLDQIL